MDEKEKLEKLNILEKEASLSSPLVPISNNNLGKALSSDEYQELGKCVNLLNEVYKDEFEG